MRIMACTALKARIFPAFLVPDLFQTRDLGKFPAVRPAIEVPPRVRYQRQVENPVIDARNEILSFNHARKK